MILIFLIIYFFVFSTVLIFFEFKREKIFPLPNLKITENKIYFYSNLKHKIRVGKANMLTIKNAIYLKQNGRMIEILNIKNARVENDFLIFEGCGLVEIFRKNQKWCKYFQMDICSNVFDLSELRCQAETELMNNLFDLSSCKQFARYLRFVKQVLKIDVKGSKLIVKQNDFKLSFCLAYDFGMGKKCIKFN